VRGHTFGSIVLYDAATKSLLSGDAIARRCFYSPSGWTPISTYFADLREIEKLDFDGILSAHDRYILPKNLICRPISTITEQAPKTERTWGRGETQYLWFVLGSGPEDPDFIDFSAPLGKKDELLADLRNMR
jgi:glyoxylase-like metal-dependent hydrolase (beta-lactamase superfamily II)